MVVELSREQARRIAVRAQLLDAPPPSSLVEVVRQLTFVQLEPTASIAPTADLVMWSRLGADYQLGELAAAAARASTVFEYDLMVRPMEDLALFKAEMARWPERSSTRRWLDDNAEFQQDVLDLIEADGPVSAREIPDTSVVAWSSGGWNNNRTVVMMLENLARRGDIAVIGRRGRDRLWDLAERVYHADIPTIPLDEALRIRNERRLHAQGVVPVKTPDLPVETTRVGDAGVDATIEGVPGAWRVDPSYLDGDLEGGFGGRTALLSPFDGLIRDRTRMQLLFEFDYALEMYKPATKRRWGYYALPILHGDRLVGKVDATADRTRKQLVVGAIHRDVPFGPALEDAVDAELRSLASWLKLSLG